MSKLRIFISSPMEDLQLERDAVEKATSGMRFEAVRAETIGARPKSPRETCLEMVRECDVYIGICGSRYGSIPPGQEVSVTEMEFSEARNCEKDVLIYVQQATKREDRQQDFIRRLEDFDEGYFRGSFSTPEELANTVQDDLSSLVSTKFRRPGEVTLGTDVSTELHQLHDEQILAIDGLRTQLNASDAQQLTTTAGTPFVARAATTTRGRKKGKRVLRYFQQGQEYGRCYECCWEHYYNCNRTRIGMYSTAVDEWTGRWVRGDRGRSASPALRRSRTPPRS